MKVYLAWNDGDYYGPDALGGTITREQNFVFATREAAMAACDEAIGSREWYGHERVVDLSSEWGYRYVGRGLGQHPWEQDAHDPAIWTRADYFVQEVEVIG